MPVVPFSARIRVTVETKVYKGMENHSPSQDDKPKERSWKMVLVDIFPFFDLLSQAFEPKTDGIQDAFDMAAVDRLKSSADFMFLGLGSDYFKPALGTNSAHRGAPRREL